MPKVFEGLCQVIESNFLDEEGIFRLAGSKTVANGFKVQIDQGNFDISSLKDPHVSGDLLKVWLREMPEPLLTHNLYQKIMDVRCAFAWEIVALTGPRLTCRCCSQGHLGAR